MMAIEAELCTLYIGNLINVKHKSVHDFLILHFIATHSSPIVHTLLANCVINQLTFHMQSSILNTLIRDLWGFMSHKKAMMKSSLKWVSRYTKTYTQALAFELLNFLLYWFCTSWLWSSTKVEISHSLFLAGFKISFYLPSNCLRSIKTCNVPSS